MRTQWSSGSFLNTSPAQCPCPERGHSISGVPAGWEVLPAPPCAPSPWWGEAGGHRAAGSAGWEEQDSWESFGAGLSWNMCDLWRCKPI